MRNFDRINTLSKHIPIVTLSMISLLILCFIFQSKLGATDSSAYGPTKLALLFSISSESIRNGHLPRLFTANLFHVNLGHLLSNIVGLLFFSSLFEIRVGKSRALIVILLSALGGTIGSLLFHMVDWMVGSSTILFGVFGGLGVLILKNRRKFHRFFVPVVISWWISLILLSTLGYISLAHVDQGAHVGGMVAGILSTLIIIYPYSMLEISKPLSLKGRFCLIVLLAIFVFSFIKEVILLIPLLA
jgi:rhomboid protease GluP